MCPYNHHNMTLPSSRSTITTSAPFQEYEKAIHQSEDGRIAVTDPPSHHSVCITTTIFKRKVGSSLEWQEWRELLESDDDDVNDGNIAVFPETTTPQEDLEQSFVASNAVLPTPEQSVSNKSTSHLLVLNQPAQKPSTIPSDITHSTTTMTVDTRTRHEAGALTTEEYAEAPIVNSDTTGAT